MKMITQLRCNGCQLQLDPLPDPTANLDGAGCLPFGVARGLQCGQFTAHLGDERFVGPQIHRAHPALETKPQSTIATRPDEPLVALKIALVA